MRLRLTILFTILSFYTILAQETFSNNGVAQNFEPIHVFTNAHIILNPSSEIDNGILIIKGNKIIAVDTSLNIPVGAIIHDLKGDYIYPSFIDLYSDYGLKKAKKGQYNYRPQYESNKAGAYHWNEAIHPEIDASREFVSDKKSAEAYLKNGFGAVLSHAQDGILRGTGSLVLLSEKSEHENIILPKAANYFSFKKGVSKQKNPSSLMGSIALIRQTFLDAEWYSAQDNQTNLSYAAVNNNQELPNIFAVNDELDYSRVYQIANEFEIDFIIKGNGKEYIRIEEVADTKFPIIIPLNFPNSYDVDNPETAEWISLHKLKDWETAPFNPGILAKNEVEFCITSSGLDKESNFITNLRLAVKKGLSKQDALAALTTTPAQLISMDHKIGSLESGYLANFFIASKDIFENGEIYENWNVGEKHNINKKQEIDIRGYYTLINKEFENKLVSITGSKEKPKATMFALDSLALTTNLEGGNVNISTKNGAFRAFARFHDGNIQGKYQDSIGDYYNFKLKRDSLFEETKKPFTLTIDSLIPSVWFPNKAHGFTSTPKAEKIIFRNATIWTNEQEGILENTDLAISNGVIIALGKDLDELIIFPETVKITQINATNKHLTSGIIDEHSHIAISRGVNEGSQAVSAEVRIGDVINPNDHNIYRQLSGGTVASQLLHGSANPIGGQAAMIKLRWGSAAEDMKVENADGFIKFALGENVKQSNWGNFERIRFPQTRMGVEQVFYDAFYRAKSYQRKWEYFNTLSKKEKGKAIPPREDLELNALVEVLNSERFITCHSYIQSEINMLMHIGDSMGFTINTFTHILEGYKVADKMRKHGAGGSTFSDWWAYKFEVNDAIPYNGAIMHSQGVTVAFNSDDSEMSRRLNQEAAKAVKYGGVSEEDAWKFVTLNPAKLLHIDDEVGSVKVGKSADLVLWSDHPMSIYAVAEKTMIEGVIYYDLDRATAQVDQIASEKSKLIQDMLSAKNGGAKTQKPIQKKIVEFHCETLD